MISASAQCAFRTVKFDEAALRVARHICHIDASHGAAPTVAQCAQALFAEMAKVCPELRVEHLRLWDEDTRARMQCGPEHIRTKLAVLSGGASQEEAQAQAQNFAGIEQLAWQLTSARGLVVSAPMWNYGAPYVVKQYFDCVLQPGLTYRERQGGRYEGLVGEGRPLVIVTSARGAPAAPDYLTPWLRDVGAMVGFGGAMAVVVPSAIASEQAALDSIVENAVLAAKVFDKAPTDAAERTACVGIAVAAAQASSSAMSLRGGRGDSAAALPAASNVAAGGGDAEDSEEEDSWNKERLLQWLRLQGGLSEDCLDSLESLGITGEVFYGATEDDWRADELDLDDSDIARIMDLQRRFVSKGQGADSDQQAASDSIARSAAPAEDEPNQCPSPARAEATVDGARESDDEEESACSHEKLMDWLRSQGGLSNDCLESLEALGIQKELFCAATEEDWQNEELSLEDADVVRIMDLQRQFLEQDRQQSISGFAARR